MARRFPLAPLEKIAKRSGAKRVSKGATKVMREAILEIAESVAIDAVAAARHAKRVTVNADDILISTRRRRR